MQLLSRPVHELRLVRYALRRPVRALAGIALATSLLAPGLARLELRTDGAAIHPTGNQIVKHTEADSRFFGERDRVILLLTSRAEGPPVQSRAGLRFLKDLHDSLSALPGVDAARVRSVANFLDPRPGLSLTEADDFLKELPSNAAEHRALLERMHHRALVEGLLLSPDGRAAAFYVPVAEAGDRDALVTTIEDWVESQDCGASTR